MFSPWRTGAAWAPLLPSQGHLLGPGDSGNRKAHRTPRKGAVVGAWQAPEIEALRQIFLRIQPVELIDRFAVSHVPVQVTIPVDGDAYHATLPGHRCVRSGVSGSRRTVLQLVPAVSRRGNLFWLERDAKKPLQCQGPVTLSGPTSRPSHSSLLTVSRTHQVFPASGPLHMRFPQFPTRLAPSHSVVVSLLRPSLTTTPV